MRFAVMALATAVAFGQTTKVFQLTQNQSPQDLQEITVVVRNIADIEQLSMDEGIRTLTLNASDGQVAMSSWLVQQLDLPSNATLTGAHEYRTPAAGDDVVRVLYATHAASPQALQEIAVALRSVADIGRLFVYNALKAVVVRDTDRKVSLAAWIMDQLNQPENAPAPEPHEFRISENDVARVFELANSPNPQAMQEITTLIRAVADMQRIFVYNARKSLVLRGPADRVSLASWLVSELDRPAQPGAERVASHEYRLPNDAQNVVRVFYLPPQSPEDLQKAITLVRSTAGTYRSFIYNTLNALAVRGTAGQVATAEKVLEEIRKPQSE
ncbi:MAG TPA: hypothetical protein VMR62_27400 [Bryobacteraceae bacterium]|jgi:hypothetical protein|nr:hypothetical protein [Bryobacteraceae bacterium]